MNYNELEERRQRKGLSAITDLIVYVAMVVVAGMCAGGLTFWLTGSDWWAQLVGYTSMGIAWLVLSLCWVSDRTDRAMWMK